METVDDSEGPIELMTVIQDRKHYNAILVSLKNTGDILRHIDQLIATSCGSSEMLRNSIRLKAPEIYGAVATYCAEVGGGAGSLTFAEWAAAGNHVPAEVLATASKGRDLVPYTKVADAHAKMKQKLGVKSKAIKCPYCGKKTEDLSTHSCRGNKRKKKGSVWVISGGGANRIRNKC